MVCGTEQVGKTTLISYLCNSIPDNGNGSIRENIMYHEHEKISGNTTSIKKQILGVKEKDSKLINYNYSNNWEEITKVSDKIINIYDTPGNKKYMKNILNAICTHSINLILFLEDEEKEFSSQFEYYSLLKEYCKFAKIELCKIITKKQNKSCNQDELIISCTKPELSDMNLLKLYLMNFNKTNELTYLCRSKSDIMFRIINVFNIPDCDNIIEGVQVSGDLKLDNYYLIYPDLTYKPIKIKTIFRKKIESKQLHESETGSLTFGNFDKNITKNCIILNHIDFSNFNIKENIIQLNIIKRGVILNKNKTNYFLINGNLCYNVNILNILNQNDSKVSIQLPSKIYFQDKIIFLLPTDFKCFSEVFLLEI